MRHHLWAKVWYQHRVSAPSPSAAITHQSSKKTCPAVIGDALVYRNGSHLTATYVRTLAPWLGERLPEPAAS
jgi:hypothetical protein